MKVSDREQGSRGGLAIRLKALGLGPTVQWEMDALNMTLCLDHLVAKEFEGFKPHFNLFKMDKPLKPSGTAYISKPLAGALSEFFDSH